MDIRFATRHLQRLCSEKAAGLRELGDSVAASLQQRLAELEAAVQLGELEALPHLTVAVRKEQPRVVVDGPLGLRLVVVPEPEGPMATRPSDWRRAEAVRIVRVLVRAESGRV
jgi:hypothetical protein